MKDISSLGPVSRSANLPAPRRWRWLLRLLALTGVAVIFYFSLRGAELADVTRGLRALQPWQLAILAGIDVAIHSLMAARWWLILRTEDPDAPYPPLIGIRLAAFGISYFTIGPQVGGEPLQILYLRRQHGTSLPRATASVLMDKLLELLANFLLLLFALAMIPRAELLGGLHGLSLIGLVALLGLAAWPTIHILLLRRRRYPLSALLHTLPGLPQDSKVMRHLRASERLAGQFCQRHPRALIGAAFTSLLAAGASVMEYAFITSFVAPGLSFSQNVSAWCAGWLSFLFPTPAGLGALEASQVLTLGAFGVPAGIAIVVALVMRARDLLFGGAGLLIAGLTAARLKSGARASGVPPEEAKEDGRPVAASSSRPRFGKGI